jgi:flagellar basal body-associated protein FliL
VKSKLKFVIPLVVLLVLGGGYKFVLAKPKEVKHKVEGVVYVLPKEFLINLADGRYAKLSVALVLPHDALPAAGGHGAATPPEGYGALEQEAIVRATITDVITDHNADDLTSKKKRKHLRHKILKKIEHHSDVHPHEVLFTDLAVQ